MPLSDSDKIAAIQKDKSEITDTLSALDVLHQNGHITNEMYERLDRLFFKHVQLLDHVGAPLVAAEKERKSLASVR